MEAHRPRPPAPPPSALPNPDEPALQDWLTDPGAGDALPSWLAGDLPEVLTAAPKPAAPHPAPTAKAAPVVVPRKPAAPQPAPARRPEPVPVSRPVVVPDASPSVSKPVTPVVQLRVAVGKPSAVEARQAACFLLQVSNTGSAVVDQVALRFEPSPDWSRSDQAAAGVSLGRLAPGAKKRLRLTATPTRGGLLSLPFTLTAPGGFRGAGQARVRVVDTAIRLEMTATPAQSSVGGEVTVTVTVLEASPSDGPPLFVRLPVPEGLEPASSSDNGMYEAATRTLLWRLRTAAGANLTARLRADLPGDFVLAASGEAAGRTVSPAEARLRVELAPPDSSRALDDLIGAIDREITQAATALRHRLVTSAAPLPEIGTANRYVLFTVGPHECAIPLTHVLEIGQPQGITPVPHVPDWVLGVASVRGDIVSLVDLGRFLECPPGPGSRRQMLLVRSQRDELTTGLVVDAVRGIRSVTRDRLTVAARVTECPGHTPGRVSSWVGSIIESDTGRVFILDIERLLLSPDLRL